MSPAASGPPRIADYELLRLIGSGSYGDVWLARGITGVFRAVKIVWRERFEDARPYEREFAGITRFAAISVREPSQLALLHAGRNDTDAYFYYVMELADDAEQGRAIEPEHYVPLTLREVRERRGRLPPAEVVSLGVALSRALATLHAEGLVHRDIKPSNVVFVGGVPKLADVGLVTAASEGVTFVGTEGYVPREGPGAPAADVYSLGKVLYELATGLDRNDWPRLPSDLVGVPEWRALLELNEVLVRACETDAGKRFTEADALLEELLLLQAGKSVRRLRAAERHLSRAIRAAAVLAIAATLGGAGAWIEHRRAAKAEAERDALAHRSVYAATLGQAQRAIEKEDFGRARRLLEQAATSGLLRGLEWNALARQAHGDAAVVLRGSGASIDRIALDKGGRLVAVHDENKSVVVYDARNHTPIQRIEGVQRLAGFSADGTRVLGTTTSPLAAPQQWLVATGRPVTTTPARIGLRPIGVGPDDTLIAISDSQPPDRLRNTPSKPIAVVVWDFERGKARARLALDEESHSPPWEFFRSSAEPGKTEFAMACVRRHGATSRFRLTRIQLSPRPTFQHHELEGFLPSVIGATVREDGSRSWWAVESASGRRLVLDSSSGSWALDRERLPIGISLTAAVEGASEHATVRAHASTLVLESSTAPHRRFRGHGSLVTAAAASATTGVLFSGAQDGELRAWQLADTSEVGASFQCHNPHSGRTNIVYAPSGSRIYAPADEQNVWALAATSAAPIEKIGGIKLPLAATEAGIWALAGDDHSVAHWSHAKRRIDRTVALNGTAIARAVFSTNLRWLVICRTTGEAELHDLSTRGSTVIPTAESKLADRWLRVLSDEGNRVWSISRFSDISCHELPGGVQRWKSSLPARPTDICRFIALRQVAVALENGHIQFHDEDSGQLLSTVVSGSAAPQSVFASTDGRLIAAGIEGELHVIDAESRTYLTRLQIGSAEPLHIGAAAPDGSSVAVLSKTGMLRIVRVSE